MMTRDEKRQKLESFGRGPALLSIELRRFPKKMWLYRPSADRWSIHEIIHHLADSEAAGYVQCRSFIAEPGARALQPDVVRWVDSLGYFHQSTREALELIRRLRKTTYQLLQAVPESTWSFPLQNPDGGYTSLEDWLAQQEQHIPHHLEQMQANYVQWLRTNPQKATSPVVPERSLEPLARRSAANLSLASR